MQVARFCRGFGSGLGEFAVLARRGGGGSRDSMPSSWTRAVGLPAENQRSIWSLYGSWYQLSASTVRSAL